MAPLMKGFSQNVVSSNIKEMMKAGHPQKQAIATALAMKRKYQNMAQGGMVQSEEHGGMEDIPKPEMGPGGDNESEAEMARKGPDDYERNIVALNAEGDMDPSAVANPVELKHNVEFIAALKKRAMDDSMSPESYAMGGLVSESHSPSDLGNKPSENMEDETEEPMSSMPSKPDGGHAQVNGDQAAAAGRDEMYETGKGLSAEAAEALRQRKMARRYRQVTV